MAIILEAVEISGLIQPTYNSGAANKYYVDVISGNLDGRFVASGLVLTGLSSQSLSGSLVAIHTARDIYTWDSTDWHNSSLMWNDNNKLWIPKPSGGAGGATNLNALTDVIITNPVSGEILVYKQDNARWENEMPSMTFNIANVRLYSGQNINITRFTCPAGKSAYIWQATACNSGGASISGLCIEMISGHSQLGTWSSVYKTSSAILKEGYPLGKSEINSNIEIRFMYSGAHEYGAQATQSEYGTAFMNISIY